MPPQPEKTKESKLKNVTIALMVSVAIFYDSLQALLNLIFMGWLVTPVAFLTFWIWFQIKAVSFMTAQRITIVGGGTLVEMIPMLDTLPAWTAAVALMAINVRMKEKAGI